MRFKTARAAITLLWAVGSNVSPVPATRALWNTDILLGETDLTGLVAEHKPASIELLGVLPTGNIPDVEVHRAGVSRRRDPHNARFGREGERTKKLRSVEPLLNGLSSDREGHCHKLHERLGGREFHRWSRGALGESLKRPVGDNIKFLGKRDSISNETPLSTTGGAGLEAEFGFVEDKSTVNDVHHL